MISAENKNFNEKENMPDLSIIIVNWNGAPVLEKCLQSIDLHRDGLKLELILADNNSSDDNISLVRVC